MNLEKLLLTDIFRRILAVEQFTYTYASCEQHLKSNCFQLVIIIQYDQRMKLHFSLIRQQISVSMWENIYYKQQQTSKNSWIF